MLFAYLRRWEWLLIIALMTSAFRSTSCAQDDLDSKFVQKRVLAVSVYFHNGVKSALCGKGKGTGFVVHPDGYILTAKHLAWTEATVEDQPIDDRSQWSKFTIWGQVGSRTAEKQELKIVAVHPSHDVMLLKFKKYSPNAREAFELSYSDLNIEQVTAIGFPVSEDASPKFENANMRKLPEPGDLHGVANAKLTGGFSGGPVLRGTKVVGLIEKSTATAGLSRFDFVPVRLLRSWLDDLGIERTKASQQKLDLHPRTETVIDGYSFKLLGDANRPGTWFYIPPRLRIVERDGRPDVRVVIYVADGRENAIVQVLVTASATELELEKIRSHLRKWYAERDHDVPPLSVRMVQSLRSSAFRMFGLRSQGDTLTVSPLWDPVAKHSAATISRSRDFAAMVERDGATKAASDGNSIGTEIVSLKDGTVLSVEPATPRLTGRGLTIPGGHLIDNQDVQLQFEVAGTDVQLFEALLRGKTGGIALVWVGEYETMSTFRRVNLSLDVKAAQNYFRKCVEGGNSFRFPFWRSSRAEILDFLRESKFIDSSLKVHIDNEPINEESDLAGIELGEVSARVMNWVAHQCFEFEQSSGVTKETMAVPHASNVDLDMKNLSSLFNLPLESGTKFSVSPSSSKYVASFRRDVLANEKVSWEQRTINRIPIAIPGRVSLGRYSDPEQYVDRLTIKPLPRIKMRLPVFEDAERAAIIEGATLSLKNRLKEGGQAKWGWAFSNSKVWMYDGLLGETGSDEESRGREFPYCPTVVLNSDESTDEAEAVLVANRLNRHLNFSGAEIDRIAITRRIDTKADLIDFAGERFPLRQMEIDPRFFFPPIEGTGRTEEWAKSLKLSFGLTSGNGVEVDRKLNVDPVVLPTFDSKRKLPLTFLYPGTISSVSVDVTYDDPFDEEGTQTWVAKRGRNGDSSVLTRIATGAAVAWTIRPKDIGLKKYFVSTRTLLKQFSGAELVTVTFEGNGKEKPRFSLQLTEESKGIDLEFVTKQRIENVFLRIDTDDGSNDYKMLKNRVSDLNSSPGSFRIVKTMFDSVD